MSAAPYAEIDALMGKLREGTLTPDRAARLNELLVSDEAARREYALQVFIRADLRERFADRPAAPEATHTKPRPVVASPSASAKPRAAAQRGPGISQPTPFILYPIAIAAALLLTAAIVGLYFFVFAASGPDIEHRPSNIEHPPLATLIEATPGSTLTTPGGFISEGRDYPRGEYTLSGGGTAEFMLTNSVNVKLRGDTRIDMRDDMNVSLTRGSAEFVVPSGAEGFTVRLPDGASVVDLGTRFSIRVDERGAYAVRVAEGAVQYLPPGTDMDRVAINAGEAIRVADGQLRRLATIAAGSEDVIGEYGLSDFIATPSVEIDTDGSMISLHPNAPHQRGTVRLLSGIERTSRIAIAFDLAFEGATSGGADGIAFWIASSSDEYAGDIDGHRGQTPAPDLTVEFDSYKNSRGIDPSNAHVTVRRANNAVLDETNLSRPPHAIKDLSDSGWHRVVVTLDSDRVDVDFDGVKIVRGLDIAGALDASPRLWLGFSARTGAKHESHLIRNWSITPAAHHSDQPNPQPPSESADRSGQTRDAEGPSSEKRHPVPKENPR